MTTIFAGIALGFSLIVSLGPQNIFLIKQGIKREALAAIVTVCILSDILLYVIAVTGVGELTQRAPIVLEVLKWIGVAYLAWFGFQAFRDAATASEQELQVVEDSAPVRQASAGQVQVKARAATTQKVSAPIGTLLMLTWVNPNMWIDGVVIGGIANQYPGTGPWLFIIGATISSLIWFPMVAYGASALSRPLSSPRVWRVLNVVIGIVLTILAIKLALL
ncbi:LysE family transporter [Corynebacterium breve]|uniref:LysE family transporter n=1 Tax=Corynebacterium breve TaxID=3049799 RepID=A0ABY8VG81_9CORY|nr:LysE family transporter [Corynebacterium breve]WIM68671.1 LysE family transporter [Corynebacterium breve]